jgi:hypothetical protein
MIIITYDEVNKEVMITFMLVVPWTVENMCVLCKHAAQVT